MRDFKYLYAQLKTASRESGKSILYIIKDFSSLKKKKGLIWSEYYNFQFEQQTETFRDTFLGINEQRYYLDYLNPKKYYSIARNKYFTHIFLDAAGIKNKARLFCYYNPEAAAATDSIGYDYSSVMRILKQKNVSECVIKTTESSHGDNVHLIYSIDYGTEDCILKTHNGTKISLRQLLSREPLIFESVIKQTTQFNDFNSPSVNTIRFMTLLFPDKSVKIIAAFIKIGRKGACVDNAGKGGNVDTGIDIDTGITYNSIQFDGWRKIKDIETHPDSGNSVCKVKINEWDNIKTEIIRLQQALPYIKAAGWDIAITDDGPVVIEVNDFWDTTGQLFIGRGWRDDVRKCYFEWMSYNNKAGVSYPFERQMNVLSNKQLLKITGLE